MGESYVKTVRGLAETRYSVDLPRALVPLHQFYDIKPVTVCSDIFFTYWRIYSLTEENMHEMASGHCLAIK